MLNSEPVRDALLCMYKLWWCQCVTRHGMSSWTEGVNQRGDPCSEPGEGRPLQ